ncbi:MAG TPA: 3'-5' exonuclease [Gemmatimonadaceae bacterium]|nr:3'-5' exonuclease [Gemmatimonadaceae bacterium]
MPPAPRSRLVPADTPIHELEYAVVDVETTGRANEGIDRMIEVAAVIVRGGKVGETYSSLVNPGRPVPPIITRLTGITNAMVSTAPRFADIATTFAGHLRNRVFVAQNVGFDWAFVGSELWRATGETLVAERLCTVRLSRRLLPHLRRRNLDALAAHYELPIVARHRAFGDARATAEIFVRLLDELGRQGVHTWKDLTRVLSGRRRARARRSALPTFMTDWRIA